MSAEEIKTSRGKAKRTVTFAVKRLTQSLEKDLDSNTIKTHVLQLESAFEHFQKLHIDYCNEVNSDDFEYFDCVSDEYCNVMQEFSLFTKRCEIDGKVKSLCESLEMQGLVLSTLLDRVEDMLASDCLSVGPDAFQSDKADIEVKLSSMIDTVTELGSFTDAKEEKAIVHNLMKRCSYVSHLLSQAMRKYQMTSDKLMAPQAAAGVDYSPPGQLGQSEQTISAVEVSEQRDGQQSSPGQVSDPTLLPQSSHAPVYGPTLAPTPPGPVIENTPGYRGHNMTVGHSPWNGSQTSSVIQTKKPTLPSFSGDRKDWPEFKCVWKSLAEGQYFNKMQLAMELKKACSKGRAATAVRHIFVTSDTAYDNIWSRLSEEYDDPGLCVQSALKTLASLKAVGDRDYKGIVKLIDVVEGVHNLLKELSQLDAVHTVDIDKISMLLPRSIHLDWNRKFRDADLTTRIHPFSEFVRFLRQERSALARLVEYSSPSEHNPRKEDGARGKHSADSNTVHSSKANVCILHGDSSHDTSKCRAFKELPVKERYEAVKRKRRCFKCFGAHMSSKCNKAPCQCTKNHHKLLCSENASTPAGTNVYDVASEQESVSTNSNLVSSGAVAVYPVFQAYIKGMIKPITVFADGGSNASYVTESCAQRFQLRRVRKVTLDITTVGGVQKCHASNIYEVPLRTQAGKCTTVIAYGLKEITGPLAPLDHGILKELFPTYDVEILLRRSCRVDLMIGTDYFGLHPKEELAKAGDNLSIMKGELGICLVGTHPNLKEKTLLSPGTPRSLNGSYACSGSHLTSLRKEHDAFGAPHSFFLGEDLGIQCEPRCGACKCGKCPLPGHNLSFKEEQELQMIRSNLEYDADSKCWVTSYPWLVDPQSLPDNYGAALATLRGTERSLLKDPSWASCYSDQIRDMLDRGAARKLTQSEIGDWQGPKFHISHLAVVNPKSTSTPVRIVFNSSQTFKGVSLNDCLAKGPDSYMNNSLGILLRWREENVAIVGDIRKMFHSVYLKPMEQHCHRFLWRDLDSSREPDVYVMERVNMGDRPAAAIATEALYKTAKLGADNAPRAAEFITHSSYMDDLIDSVSSVEEASDLAKQTEDLLSLGSFQVKGWQFSKDKSSNNDDCKMGVLGVLWSSEKDSMTFQATLNFSAKKRGVRVGGNIRREEVPEAIPLMLTRRLVLQQVMSIYDPMGLISPFLLLAKINLRETWKLQLGWDNELPPEIHRKWVNFFTNLYQIEDLELPRCLRPANAVGHPWLILLSDGSELAYGCAAYARWKCSDGSYEVRLIMAKSRIAPINKVSIPRMELNGAVLSKRCRAAIVKEMRYKFERIIHLVDSETVLSMLQKTSSRFKVYEGVRVGEIQAATSGHMTEWAWIPGHHNTADLLTRGCLPKDMSTTSEWFQGPAMFKLPFDNWEIKFTSNVSGPLPGEKRLISSHAAASKSSDDLIDYTKFGSLTKLLRVVSRVLLVIRHKSFLAGRASEITPQIMNDAEMVLVQQAQTSVDMTKADFHRLNPAKRSDGVWVVGASRLANYNPMSAIHANLPIFIPRNHPLANLAMKDSHSRGHRGRDATLAAFRNRYWTPSGPCLAKRIRDACQLCKLRDTQLMQQEMGSLPIDRLRPSPPFTSVMVDLFGPYAIRGEVQKRTSGKAWAIIFTDLCSRAVHIEAIAGYDASSFLLGFTRFVSIRGWPSKVFSDPGSQLLAVSKEINEAAQQVGTKNGLEWIVGPADSPWHQGAVEALVKSAKRALNLAIHDQRLSMHEFLTVCTEAANILNERPLGLLPSIDSEINVLTPNCLLLGRATAANPLGWHPGHPSMKTRYHLVNAISKQFWKHWIELFAPSLVYRQRWFTPQCDIQVGDVVLVADSNCLKGEYRLAIVSEVFPSKDGHVRSALVSYKRFKAGEKVSEYKGAPFTSVKRSIQKLVLLVPVMAEKHEGESSNNSERDKYGKYVPPHSPLGSQDTAAAAVTTVSTC